MSASVVPFSTFLTRRKDSVAINDLETYKRVTIRMNGQGISLRDEVSGVEIGTKKQFAISAGQFLLSKIDARNGAFGIVPESCSGAIITGNFWTFDVNPHIVDIHYLDYFTKTQRFVDLCRMASDGTTNRRYLDEGKFMSLTIPLPVLGEQRRLVARLSSTFLEIENAVQLAASLSSDFDRLLVALACRSDLSEDDKMARGWRRVRLGEIMSHSKREVTVNDFDNYLRISIRLWGKGIEKRDNPQGLEIKTKKQYVVHTDDFLVAEMDAKFGAFGILPQNLNGAIVSSHYFAFEIDRSQALPECIEACSMATSFQEQVVARGSTNYSAVRPKQILDYEIWLPPMHEQNRIAEVLRAKRTYKLLNTLDKDAEALRRSILTKAFRGEL